MTTPAAAASRTYSPAELLALRGGPVPPTEASGNLIRLLVGAALEASPIAQLTGGTEAVLDLRVPEDPLRQQVHMREVDALLARMLAIQDTVHSLYPVTTTTAAEVAQ